MASASVDIAGGPRTGALLIACVAGQGTATHPYFGGDTLTGGPEASRNLADAIHFLCALHGRHPGIVDLAATRSIEPSARAWLIDAGGQMAGERLHLNRLAVAAGPIPSTPGSHGSEAAILAQRSALATLASSERRGCALGAALALAAEWVSIRIIHDAAATRLGVDAPGCALGDPDTLRRVADAACATERALLFGAEQLSLQHRGLWDLLEARQQARREY